MRDTANKVLTKAMGYFVPPAGATTDDDEHYVYAIAL